MATYREVVLPQGTLRYLDEGTGPTLVFLHGLLVNNLLWRNVITALAPDFRCIAPDLPLGSHTIPMRPNADLTPTGLARIVADFLAALELDDVTLVGNDTGGGIAQVTIANYPARITRLVLTSCDAYEHFPPLAIAPLTVGARLFGRGFTRVLADVLRLRVAQRLLAWPVAHTKTNSAVADAFFNPLIHNRDVRRDATKVMAGITKRYTLEAARTFPRFAHPVLIVWGGDDMIFPLRDAKRLQHDFPQATLHVLPGSRAFTSVDQPDALAAHIAAFVRQTVAV